MVVVQAEGRIDWKFIIMLLICTYEIHNTCLSLLIRIFWNEWMCCRQNIFAKKFVKHISDRGNVSKIHKKPLNKKIKIFN